MQKSGVINDATLYVTEESGVEERREERAILRIFKE
jgi:hypothetical protein